MNTDQRWRGLVIAGVRIACEKGPPKDLREIEHRCPGKTNHWKPHWGKKGETWQTH